MKTQNTINGMEIAEAVELIGYHESDEFTWTLADMEIDDIHEKLWDKDICPNCGKHYNDLRQKNYDSNINPESGLGCFELVCPECNETVDFIQNIYY